ncbi:hypothetical protein [Candidatus Amarobacter glycogenicus]|uniref:hypothetical protein n=1 Tax=Candidatus Amarobacter glycogenicus TaxID=3140699 RepID=UPI002A0F8423|nr:hypothetical protein [Dehalococcoidia bacterium]
MFAITTSLRDHQRQRRRQPALSVTVAASRFSLPTYPFERENTSADADAPSDAAIGVVSSVDYIVQIRNDAGALDYMLSFDGSWTNLDTVTAGQGLALRFDPVNEVFGLAYGDGTAVKFRSSTDHTGTAWTAATTLATEASAIGSIALAFDDIGDACVFYTLGTGTTLKRLRRTSGSWAGSGTNWSRSGSVASLTGLSAAWNADYFLAVTGTEVTTTHERLWAVAMGDTSLPTNAWSSLKAIAEADAAADLSFAYPHVCMVNGFLFATFQQIESGDVAASRVMFTSVNSDAQVLGTWREPFPAPYMENATDDPILSGAPLAYDTTYDQLYLLAPGVLITANRGDGTQEFSELVTACSWRETPTGCKATLTLDFSAGFTYTPQLLRVGNDLLIQHGMVSQHRRPARAGVRHHPATQHFAHRVARRARQNHAHRRGRWPVGAARALPRAPGMDRARRADPRRYLPARCRPRRARRHARLWRPRAVRRLDYRHPRVCHRRR